MPALASLSRRNSQRVYNARNYLRKLLSSGELSKAQAYAKRHGLALELPEPATDRQDAPPGAGVAGAPALESSNWSTPLPKIATKSAETLALAALWQAFATRCRQCGASTLMEWPEFLELQDKLGFLANVDKAVDTIQKTRETVQIDRIGEDDPPATVKAVVHRIVPNRAMRVVLLADGSEVICWVPNSFSTWTGLEIAMAPNEDERGGFTLVGEYGRNGVRIR